MTKKTTLIALALLTALTPFLGLPYSFLQWILPLLALLIALIAFFGRGTPVRSPHEESQA